MVNVPRPRLILASRSPRRREILESEGFEVEVVEPDCDEAPPEGESDPHRIATALALRKARSAWLRRKSGIILGADTITVLSGEIIGKPADEADAARMLGKLSGTRHSVITGVCLINADTGEAVVGSEETAVEMKKMTIAEIEEYVSSGESFGASGAYRIQETGDRFIQSVQGSFTNVVGLPVEVVRGLLERL